MRTVHFMTLVLVWSVSNLFAQGFIIPGANIRPPELTAHNVDVKIVNQVAQVHVKQSFKNVSAVRMEGVYYFPVPRDASISQFAMWVDGKKLQGEMLNRDEAAKIYEEIVRRNIDPALLEYADYRFFRLKIFPIPPGKTRKIELDYSQFLPMDNGVVRFLYPLHGDLQAGRYAGGGLLPPPRPGMPMPVPQQEPEQGDHSKMTSGCKQVFVIDLQSDVPLKNLYSPSHKVEIDRVSERQARVSYEGVRSADEGDFILYYSVSPEDLGMSLISHNKDGEAGFFLLLISPKSKVSDKEILDKDIVFILDTSGSMSGEKIEQAKDALIYCLNGLNAGDRFALLTFSSEVHAFSEELSDRSKVKEAIKFVKSITARGGTNIDAALQKALSYQDKSIRPMNIVFLTDGLPTVGNTDIKTILANVKKKNENRRIFTFGVGYDVNTFLLDKLAQQNHAVSDYIAPDENIEEKISYFFDKVSNPVLSDLRLDFGAVKVFDTFPHELPDLFQGGQLMIVGRYKKAGHTAIMLQGTSKDKEKKYTYRAQFPRQADNDFLPRLWATRKIAYLVDAIRSNGESKEVREEIEELSKKYGVMSPYTSFIVLEDRSTVLSQTSGVPASPVRYKRAAKEAVGFAAPTATGASAVQMSKSLRAMREVEQIVNKDQADVRYVNGRTFYFRDNMWVDSEYKEQKTLDIKKGSQAYINLLLTFPELGKFMSLGDEIIVGFKDKFIHIGSKGIEKASGKKLKKMID